MADNRTLTIPDETLPVDADLGTPETVTPGQSVKKLPRIDDSAERTEHLEPYFGL